MNSDSKSWLLAWLRDDFKTIIKTVACLLVGFIVVVGIAGAPPPDDEAGQSMNTDSQTDSSPPLAQDAKNDVSDKVYSVRPDAPIPEEQPAEVYIKTPSETSCLDLENDVRTIIADKGLKVLEFSVADKDRDKLFTDHGDKIDGSCVGDAYTDQGRFLVAYWLLRTPKGQILVQAKPITDPM